MQFSDQIIQVISNIGFIGTCILVVICVIQGFLWSVGRLVASGSGPTRCRPFSRLSIDVSINVDVLHPGNLEPNESPTGRPGGDSHAELPHPQPDRAGRRGG